MPEGDLSNQEPRLRRLDALRGIAACTVAFGYHATQLFDETWFVALAPLPIAWLRIFGWTGVDLFFVLSGFVMAHVYADGVRLWGRYGLRNFASARLARLYPLHVATFLFCALAFAGSEQNSPIISLYHLAMLQALVEPVGYTFNGPSWSISVEVFCYLGFAALTMCGPRVLRLSSAIAVCVGLFSTLSATTAATALYIPVVLGRGLLGFFAGVFLWTRKDRLESAPSWQVWTALVAGFVLHVYSPLKLAPLSLLAWPAMIILALRLPFMDRHVLRWLGERSYSIYLVHVPLLNIVFVRTEKLVTNVILAIAMWAGMVVTILLVSDLTYRLIEVPSRTGLRHYLMRTGASRSLVVP